MSSKTGIDLGGAFLDTIKPSSTFADQVKIFKQFSTPSSNEGWGSVSRGAVGKEQQDWDKLLADAAKVVEVVVPPPTVDPMTALLGAIIQKGAPAAMSELVQPTGLDVTRLMGLVANAEQFGLIKRVDGEPPRFSVTSEGQSVFTNATAK